VAFSSSRGGGAQNLYWKAADGTGAVERLTESENTQYAHVFSPDGKQFVFQEIHPQNGRDLSALSLDGDGSLTPLLATEFNERGAEISPDGRWLAYQSDASGEYEIYVRPFPNVGEGLQQVSRDGGIDPLWARDGSELFYRNHPGGGLMAVSVRIDPSLDFGNPEIVFEESYFYTAGTGGRTYDVSPSGERFLMIKEGGGSEDTAAPPSIVVVQNWFEELKRLVPTN
jgi:serine/threonine-protein kinase